MISVTGYATVISGKTVDGDHGTTNITAAVCNELAVLFPLKSLLSKIETRSMITPSRWSSLSWLWCVKIGNKMESVCNRMGSSLQLHAVWDNMSINCDLLLSASLLPSMYSEIHINYLNLESSLKLIRWKLISPLQTVTCLLNSHFTVEWHRP